MPDSVRAKLVIRKLGAPTWPWLVHCPECPRLDEVLHIVPGVGVTVVNGRGIGNSSHRSAIAAAGAHIRAHTDGRFR